MLLEREEDLIFQEHAAPSNKVATMQALAAERGRRMDKGRLIMNDRGWMMAEDGGLRMENGGCWRVMEDR